MDIRELGKFTLLEHMGKGSVATVYRATRSETDEIVAIKIFRATSERPANTARKLRDREVRMLISIQHPNVVRYYESGQFGDSFYYTMEFVENSLLERMRRPEPLSLTDKVDILRQTINALQAVHHQGIVHRDVKPGNILLDQDPSGAIHVKVTDLGIAKHVSETDLVGQGTERRVPGTPKYLSPEQILLRPVDGRADIFSLGVVAYELLSERLPFKARTSEQYVEANLHQEPRPLHQVNPQLEGFFGQLVAKMLVKDREERYDSDTLGRDLDLTYQHLVSEAPLVEQTNAASIFYVPPASEEAEEAAPARGALTPHAWAISAALVVVGILVGLWLWPALPPPQERAEAIDLSGPSGLAAADAAQNEQPWRALALVRAADAEGLDEAGRQALAELSRRLQQELAGPGRQAGLKMLEEGRLAEARIVLERMRDLYPDAPQTRQLADAIDRQDTASARRREWEGSLGSLATLRKSGRFSEAIEKAEGLLAQYSSDGGKVAQLRTVTLQTLRDWAQTLLRPGASHERIEEFLAAVWRYRDESWARDSELRDRSARLSFELAQHYEKVQMFEEAARYYGAAAAEGDERLSADANAALSRIASRAQRQPMALQELARIVQSSGLAGSVWRAETAHNGTQEVADGVLSIVQEGAVRVRVSLRETIRPVRNDAGFTVSVRFKTQPPAGQGARRCEAGLEVQDRRGNMVTVYFDGANYNMSRSLTRGGRVIQGGSSVRRAFGDEGAAWHEMTLRYLHDTERVVAMLDGKEVDDYNVRLGDFQVRVFARVTGAGTCRVAFKDFKCGP